MSGVTGSPADRVVLPDACPGCGRSNARGYGWVEYAGQPDYPVVGCGGCGHVVYVTEGALGYVADNARERAPQPASPRCECGHALAHHRPADHPTAGPGCWRCGCNVPGPS